MPVLRQLAAARREGRLSGRVVVLAGADKEEMDEALAEDDEVKGTLDVVTRHGTPTDLADMQRVSAGTAKRIIVVPPAGGCGGVGADGRAARGGHGGGGARVLIVR